MQDARLEIYEAVQDGTSIRELSLDELDAVSGAKPYEPLNDSWSPKLLFFRLPGRLPRLQNPELTCRIGGPGSIRLNAQPKRSPERFAGANAEEPDE